MAELHENLASLRGLYQDLSATTDSSFLNVERLIVELETHIDDFQKLLDKPAKSNGSRQTVLSGKITVAEIEYSINEDFQQGALQLADALNIDELEAAVMFLAAQEDSRILDRPPLITAIMRFHERRHFLLECLRLICRGTCESEEPGIISPLMNDMLARVLKTVNGTLQNASDYTRKALHSLGDIERWLALLGDQIQKASIVGQEEDQDIMEAIEYQRRSLQQQHESLAAVLFYLFQGTYTSAEDFRVLANHLKKLDRLDVLLVHYVPIAIAAFNRHGSSENGSSTEARSLHGVVTQTKDGQSWRLPQLHASMTALWLAIYSGWYFENDPSDFGPSFDAEKEAEERTKTFMTSLDDGALELLLAICASVNSEQWAEPARSELVALLLKESPISLPDSSHCSAYMKGLLMETLEIFVESCIANMPDAVRRLKSEEDIQRLDQITALRDGLTSSTNRAIVEAKTHLETFLMIISFAYEHRVEPAQEWWSDADGNLYGFLQWASKRQTVPRVSAFCEMLCSISEGEENAAAAHRFLTEEEKFLSTKLKRSTNMNWSQMFAELHLYATRVTEKAPVGGHGQQGRQGTLSSRKTGRIDLSEPESPVMLTSYLRLIGHLCKQSAAIRNWMLQNRSFKVAEELLTLCRGPIPTHLRATIFTTLSALMTDRTPGDGFEMWESLNSFLTSALVDEASNLVKAPAHSNHSLWYEQQALQKIGEAFDQTNAFVTLINSLVTPNTGIGLQPLSLAFPDSLGAAYRMPGIEPFIDFVMGHALCRRGQDLGSHNSRLLTYNCLEFVVTSLRTFNEELVTFLSCSTLVDSAAKAHNLEAYTRLHPFSRVMEWLFNENVLRSVFSISRVNISEVAQASSDSVLVLTVLRSVEVMNLIMDLQSTYFNIVKPLVKSKFTDHSSVATSSLASFEDSVLNNLSLVPALCLFCGTGHEQLTVTSLSLLEKLTSSRKLNKMSSPEIIKWQSSNKIVEVLASEVDVDSVARSLVSMMEPDLRELEYGPKTAGYVIRESLLALLNSCLGMITDRPTVAHLLLGFSCLGNVLDLPSNGLFAQGMSLLHAIIGFLQQYPDEVGGTITSYTVHLKRMAFEVIKHLWSSKLATFFTLSEMRSQAFLVNAFASQQIIGPNTLWNGFPVSADDFWMTDATSALAEFLLYRSHLFSYAATEIRSAAKVSSPTLQASVLSTLLGNSTLDSGELIQHVSVFDLFDFADLDTSRNFHCPQLTFLDDLPIHECVDSERGPLVLFDIAKIDELIRIRKSELFASSPTRPQNEEAFEVEAETLKVFILATNQLRQILHNRYLALRAWAELVTTITTCSVLDDATRPTFILHAIQLILPKLEASLDGDSAESIELARLGETLISQLATACPGTFSSRSGDIIDEKLHQLFQVSMRGIMLASGNVALREVFYSICSIYVNRISSQEISHENLRRKSQQMIKTAGPGLVEAICDDAYTGQETCRAAALLLLNSLAALDSRTDGVLAESMSQSNYLSLFFDSLRSLPFELRNAQAADTASLLAYYESLLALLQQLSRTKSGATHVIKSGLFESVRESQLFAADPDIGIDIDNPDALRKYYDLLLCVIRVIVSAVLSRGAHNEQIKMQTQAFISENRPCMVGVFKRFAKIGGTTPPAHREALSELVKSFMALVAAADFIEFDDPEVQQSTQPTLFS
ncbi:Uncharacterized protein PECH_003350 [Penicillium ucsense]|uniref:Nuclear pore complex subunit Nup192 n=1 Tax=Penicillium ucsense TaxID=2839758 RepID=A0A8J8WB96_9EURO|nr:Uncharacterized protein PECM_000160 [Penicillium ucsense]KAF7739374.1 Uncharacterized protein PECH_003350 [Penicillium ucsense]